MNREYEASMNVDLKNVVDFMTQLDGEYNFGFDLDQVEVTTYFPEVGEDVSCNLFFSVGGKSTNVEYRVFLEDEESALIYLYFENDKLAAMVSKFMRKWADSKGL